MPPNLPSLALTGLVLGWSVAWPPGPINTEAVRRGLARRPWPAYAVVLGGCVGDALWALLVGVAAGSLAERVAALRGVLGVLSVGLLLVLAALFLRGGWQRLAEHRAGRQIRPRTALDSSRGSFALGLTLALTGPWNLVFWLAVVGQAASAAYGVLGSLVVAAGVLAGAATWGVVLCVGVSQLGARFATPSWEIFTQLATGLLMAYFAVRTAVRLMGA
jgi:chemosensory pili system protein ChpE